MPFLLDTHVLIWFVEGDNNLPKSVREAIETSNQNFVSMASFWEMAIKVSLGNLELTTSFVKYFETVISEGFIILPVDFIHTVKLSELPFHHRDPFDRTLIAQALSEQLTVITKEKLFEEYGVTRLW
ncbi:type II toxin-antitoxin system VapC family toxin [Runella salmonicolor]|uniref:Type II toxin-antitoxin system VapC family toxin n=1 Tax=Runella salmonicolor TaxID=2950278 RepID=A0ABT1FQH3_9BACT|nr:type II toxin-antitoxin system VapC family toxin [Runella salmonicolor]MCP1384019.1 type II toxin-antitoxin system VapC family toxin [Runella salmonicolor]